MKRMLLPAALLIFSGCGGDAALPDPGEANVQWIDRNGETWFAPPVTPAPDEPIHDEHPDPGVVVIDRAARKKTVVKDPTEFLKKAQKEGGAPRWMFIREDVAAK